MKFVWTIFFAFAIGVGLTSNANAASLFGKVVEVSEGDTISIYNLNRNVRVRLLGVDAPELKQHFGDVSRQHLADLVLDKFVTVEYSGIDNGSIVGKVTLNGADICAQMVRDGAAWFDGNQRHVGEVESQVYQQSELAARNEKRGIWQDQSPVAPWEFARAEIERRKPVVEQKVVDTTPAPRRVASGELSSESVRFSGLPARTLRPQRLDGEGEIVWSNNSPDEPGKTMHPQGQLMTAYAPTNGRHVIVDIPWQNETLAADYYMAMDAGTIFQVLWMTGPATGETDEEFLKDFFSGYLRSMGKSFEQGGGPGSFACYPSKTTNIAMGGFNGKEYDLKDCTIPGLARIFTQVEGENRRVYFSIAMYRPGGDSGDAYTFVRSLKVGAAARKK